MDPHPLLSAILRQDATAVAACLARGADANICHGSGSEMQHALHQAAMGGDVAILRLLHVAGAGVNALNGLQRTPYFLAVINGHAGAADFLQATGAKFSTTEGETPLGAALFYRQEGMALHLLDQGADPRQKNAQGETPLHFAAGAGQIRTAKRLLDLGVDVNAMDARDSTPLIRAIALKQDALALLLLDHNAAPQGENRAGNSALTLAVRERLVPVIRRLIECGANTDLEKTQAGRIALSNLPHAKEYLEIHHLLKDAPKLRADYEAALAEKRQLKTATTHPLRVGRPLTFIRRR